MDLENYLKALEHTGYPFPEEAVCWAVAHPSGITPALLDSLRETPPRPSGYVTPNRVSVIKGPRIGRSVTCPCGRKKTKRDQYL